MQSNQKTESPNVHKVTEKGRDNWHYAFLNSWHFNILVEVVKQSSQDKTKS